jgi:hypothetical protein
MTRKERLLALDAALVACIGLLPEQQKVMHAVELAVDAALGLEGMPEAFCDFMDEQKAAVQALAANPQVFGAASEEA